MHPNQYSNLVSRLLGSYRSSEPPPVESGAALETEPSSLTELLGDSIVWHQTLPPSAAKLYAIPRSLPPQLRVALNAIGIDQLYSHQLKCLKAVRQGKDVILCTSTSSGKSLAAYLPILEGILTDDCSALSFYSLKALASDQGDKLVSLLNAIPRQDRPQMAVLNGDLGFAEREARLAQRPSIVGATPELIHYALAKVYRHQPWQEFLWRLRFILIDEAHTYKGTFGANMANLIARLMLAVDTVGGCSEQLQFLFLSATVGNPVGVAKRLTRRRQRAADGTKRIVCLTKSGAATPQRELIVTRPTANPNPETARIVLFLIEQGLRGLCFCNGREALKTLLSTLHSEAKTQNSPDAAQVALFYGGLTKERRARTIELLDTGAIRCLLST